MPSKKTAQHTRQVYLLVFTVFAVVFFNVTSIKFGHTKFEISGINLMMLQLGMFSFAVFLMVWKVILPFSKKISKKGVKKIFS